MGLRKCVICGKEIERGYGHNAEPIADGRCCDSCDDLYVFPMRIAIECGHEELAEIVLEAVANARS